MQRMGNISVRAGALRLGLGVSSFALGPSACTLVYHSDIEERQCKTTSDCAEDAERLGYPLQCRERVCQASACAETSECPLGTACVEQVCEVGSGELYACSEDTDCAEADERCGFDGVCYKKWGCLDNELDWSKAETPLTYSIRVRDVVALNDLSVAGKLDIVACGTADPQCEQPIVAGGDIQVGEDALVTVPFEETLPNGFTGFIKFASREGEADPILPVYRLFNAETPLITTLVAISLAFNVKYEEGSGLVQNHIFDCGGRPAPDVSLSVAGLTDVGLLYLGPDGPIGGLTATTTEGIVSLINVPANSSQRLVFRDENLDHLITDRFTVFVRGDAQSYVVYFPRFTALRAWLDEATRRGLLP